MSETGAKGKDKEQKELCVSIPTPLTPAMPAFVQLVGTVNTLWGSDRILRTGQFLGRYIGGSREV